MNELFIYMDDSGVLTKNEGTFVYAGLFFYSAEEYNTFIIRYKSIIDDIKCKYCKNKHKCNNDCPEIKGTSKLTNANRRRIINLIKKQKCYGVLINNQKIFKRILDNKLARGRFCEYAQKRVVKEIVSYAIKNKAIDNLLPLTINIKIDENNAKSNGYYNLHDSIFKELKHGMKNDDYAIMHKPIHKSKLLLKVRKYNSKLHYGIQSADMIANFVHRKFKQNNIDELNFMTIKLFLP